MAHGSLQKLTDDTFAAVVAAEGVVAVVEFWASWCNPCRMIEPVVRQLAAEFEGRAVVTQVDTDQNRELANRFEINAVPTILVLRGGEPFERFIGLTTYDRIAEAVESAIEGASSGASAGAAAG